MALAAGSLVEAPLVKQQMRERFRSERRARPADERLADARALATVVLEIPEVANASCVALHASSDGGPGTGPLRARLLRSGVRVLLPVLLGDGRLDWVVDGGQPVPGAEEAPDDAVTLPGGEGIAEADVVLVPALAVDTLGNRLGQGHGFYDRTLRELHRSVPVFAVVYDDEVLDAAIEAMPVEPHDRPVDAVVTPQRCLRLHWRR